MDMGCVAFQACLAMALRDRPRWTTAGLNETTVVFWDGEWARGATFHADGSGRLVTEFELNERTCSRLHADLVAWLAAPR